MARPKEFNRDEALGNAIRVFAGHGYEGASTQTLLEGMGINRQSMYDTFGDKRRLYLEALERYCTDSTAQIVAMLSADASARKGLETALLSFASRPSSKAQDGCLGVSSSVEFGRSDAEIASITDASAGILSAGFARCIRKGQQSGEFANDLDPMTASRFLCATLTGLKVAARAGSTPSELRGIARMALRSLK
jgi:TetR/AcrR family transcriptional repressor of nem operon